MAKSRQIVVQDDLLNYKKWMLPKVFLINQSVQRHSDLCSSDEIMFLSDY